MSKIQKLIKGNQVEAAAVDFFYSESSVISKEVLEHFYKDGRWKEYGYKSEDDSYGYYGVIPACFWIFALTKKSILSNEAEAILYSTVNYLLEMERNGCLRKTQYNRNDVLNTNLLAAAAVNFFKYVKLDRKSYKYTVCENYVSKIIFRTLLSQKLNGAFPYQSNSRHISLTYHYMVHALLLNLQVDRKNQLINRALKKSKEFIIQSIKSGDILWNMDTSGDKLQIIWAYAWLEAAGYKNIKSEELTNYYTFNKLCIDSFGKDDYRNTAWCWLTVIVRANDLQKKYNSENKKYYTLKLFGFIVMRLFFKAKIFLGKISRKLLNTIFFVGHEPW
jgi:hypothetical protein